MTGRERRKAIQQLAMTKGTLSACELASHFDVSRMTIHRDLEKLHAAGELRRIHGGAVPGTLPARGTAQSFCQTCSEPVLPHQSYLQQVSDHDRETFCCASCGLRTQLQQGSPHLFYATDMISGKILPAEKAYFLIRSSAIPCCQPSILTFADAVEASTFRASFGGVLGRITEALDFLRTEQTLKNSR